MVKAFRKIIFLIAIIFLINFISASFTNGNLSHSINKIYSPSSELIGWINASFSNEPTNSILKCSFDDGTTNSISLFNLIKKSSNLGFSYTCSPLDCNSDYSTVGSGELSKSFSLNAKESSIVGFKITSSDLISEVSSFSLKLTSDNPETPNLPLSADILNDEQIDWKADIASDNFNSAGHGCYLDSSSNSLAEIISTSYCERITLSESPAVNIGADIVGTESVPFTMSIESVDGTSSKKTCSATASGNGKVGCTPTNFYVSKGDYFVCIKITNPVDARKYKIAYEQNNPCGFSGFYSGTYNYDFNIFAETKKYAPIGTITFNDPKITQQIKNYISARYENNCSKGCVIPIKFKSEIANQNIALTEPALSYTAGIATTEISLYEFTEIPAKITSPAQKLKLDEAKFLTPKDYGNYSFSISLNDVDLFSDKITIENAPIFQYLTPSKTAISYPTKFMVVVNSTRNITSYHWDFGDGNNLTTKTGGVTYSYSTIGDYELVVSATDSKNISSSRKFRITVVPASEFVPILLQQTRENVNSIKSQISGFSLFEQKSIISLLKLDDVQKMVLDLNSSITESSTESDYEIMLGEILNASIPKSLGKTALSGNLLYYPKKENINLNSLTQITGETYEIGGEETYQDAILGWNDANLETTMVYSEISASYEDYEAPLVRIFDITITKKDGGSPYLIIAEMNNLFFDQDYSFTEGEGYQYLQLNNQETHIVFSTTDEVDFIDLPLFISPEISELDLISANVPMFQKGLNKWVLFALIVLVIVIIWFIVWIIIKLWYKRKYENYLFKNRNNLLNLINYIDGEKKKGLKEREISSNLRKAGWNYEQISYALKKYSNKKIV